MKEQNGDSGHDCASVCDAPSQVGADFDFGGFPPASYEVWKAAAVAALKGASFEKSMFTQTYEGIQLEPLYTAEHTENLTFPKTYPGSDATLRGSSASGYLSRPWETTQPCNALSPSEANRQLLDELEKGLTTVGLRLDERTLYGSSASTKNADGLSLSLLEDLEVLFEGVDLERYGLHVYAGPSAVSLLGYLAAFAQKRGSRLHGCVGADPIGAWLEKGKLFCDRDELFDEMAHTIYWTENHMPNMRTALLRGDVYHNGGASAVQEVGYVMAAAIETTRALRVRHLDVGVFARHLRFEFSLGSNFFMEIAKIRAARLIWSQIAEAFGGDRDSKKAEIFGRTSFFTKTVYDPYVNLLRNTTEAFSGVLGGVDGLTVGCFDEAIRPSDEFSRRVSRNLQNMLKEEFFLLQPLDPAGGSWYLETLTDTLARKSWELIQKIEGEGGLLQALREGTVQAMVEGTLAQRFKKLASRSDRAVGTNMYPNTGERSLISEAETKSMLSQLSQLSQRREEREKCRGKGNKIDKEAAKLALDGLVSQSEKNLQGGELIERVAAAAKAGVAIEEVRALLDEGNDPDNDPDGVISPITPHRWTEQYEIMRGRTEDFKARTGGNVRIFLANMGPIPQHKARADFVTSFMEVANFEVLKNDGFPTVEACAAAVIESGADVAVICSTDATYPELVPPLARRLKERRPSMKVLLAGAPAEEFKTAYIEAGVDDFVSVRSNCLTTLSDLQKTKEML
ncbi:MAG: methylmalonyl-CoA mutase subunit beta [Synergistaceae bacterium]|nr:methylmalonyl-CoA mutase subunit beta [Synergistaceae bacterium]